MNTDNDLFILKKNIDWSLCINGLSIPVEFQDLIHKLKGGYIEKGEYRNIKIDIDGKLYEAQLNNLNFDTKKYEGHKDILQIRYSESSEIAKKIRDTFTSSYSYIKQAKSDPANKRKQIKIPEDINEYIVLYATDIPNQFRIDCFTNSETRQFEETVRPYSETEFENIINLQDPNTGYTVSNKFQRIRKLNNSIAKSLKELYDYRCQITGEKVGDEYGESVVEAHHIEYFTKSLNNDASNIVIINPTFHRIIHKNNPVFDRKKLAFIFPNGVEVPLKLNKHL